MGVSRVVDVKGSRKPVGRKRRTWLAVRVVEDGSPEHLEAIRLSNALVSSTGTFRWGDMELERRDGRRKLRRALRAALARLGAGR